MKRLICFIILSIALCNLLGCSQKVEKKELFIVTESGKKQYKNEDGILVKNDWAIVDGKSYYFDLNGYMLTNQIVEDEYYVDENGVMRKNYWLLDESNEGCFFGEDGKVVKDDIVKIGTKSYVFDENGKWVKNDIYFIKKLEKYVLVDENGEMISKEGLCEFRGTEYNLDSNYFVITNYEKTNGKWFISYYKDTKDKYMSNTKYLRGFVVNLNPETRAMILEGDKSKINYIYINIIIDKDGLRFKLYNSRNELLHFSSKEAYLVFDVFNDYKHQILWDEEGYITVSSVDKEKIIDDLLKGKEKMVYICEESKISGYVYTILIDADGFKEIYEEFYK